MAWDCAEHALREQAQSDSRGGAGAAVTLQSPVADAHQSTAIRGVVTEPLQPQLTLETKSEKFGFCWSTEELWNAASSPPETSEVDAEAFPAAFEFSDWVSGGSAADGFAGPVLELSCIYLFIQLSCDHTAAAGHSGGMLAKHTLQKASVTSGDGISSAFINFCIIFSKGAFLLMLEDYWTKHFHTA